MLKDLLLEEFLLWPFSGEPMFDGGEECLLAAAFSTAPVCAAPVRKSIMFLLFEFPSFFCCKQKKMLEKVC